MGHGHQAVRDRRDDGCGWPGEAGPAVAACSDPGRGPARVSGRPRPRRPRSWRVGRPPAPAEARPQRPAARPLHLPGWPRPTGPGGSRPAPEGKKTPTPRPQRPGHRPRSPESRGRRSTGRRSGSRSPNSHRRVRRTRASPPGRLPSDDKPGASCGECRPRLTIRRACHARRHEPTRTSGSHWPHRTAAERSSPAVGARSRRRRPAPRRRRAGTGQQTDPRWPGDADPQAAGGSRTTRRKPIESNHDAGEQILQLRKRRQAAPRSAATSDEQRDSRVDGQTVQLDHLLGLRSQGLAAGDHHRELWRAVEPGCHPSRHLCWQLFAVVEHQQQPSAGGKGPGDSRRPIDLEGCGDLSPHLLELSTVRQPNKQSTIKGIGRQQRLRQPSLAHPTRADQGQPAGALQQTPLEIAELCVSAKEIVSRRAGIRLDYQALS